MKSYTHWMMLAERWDIPESRPPAQPKPYMGFPYAHQACFAILSAWRKAGEVRTESKYGVVVSTTNYPFGASLVRYK